MDICPPSFPLFVPWGRFERLGRRDGAESGDDRVRNLLFSAPCKYSKYSAVKERLGDRGLIEVVAPKRPQGGRPVLIRVSRTES